MTNENPEGQRSGETKDKQKDESDNSRRMMLKTSLGLSVVLAMGGIGAMAKSLISPGAQPTSTTTQTASSSTSQPGNLPPPSSPGFPVIKIANLKDLDVATPVIFNYPLEDQPNQLFKFGKKFKDGVGPDGAIVAYSGICQHMGCT